MNNKNKILIDVGSSTVKASLFSDGKTKTLIQRSILFKNGFDPEGGISASAKKELFELIESIKKQNEEACIKIYATGIFRKLNEEAKISFIDEFFLRTGLYFNIISQDLENFYLEMALTGNCSLNEPVLLINIGGSSVELVLMYGEEAIERKNIDIGAGIINTKYPSINEDISGVEIDDIVDYISNFLPELTNKVNKAFYNGGELTYMRLVGYNLTKNTLFNDPCHPSVIHTPDFIKKNKEVFKTIKLKELEALMPHDPKWMHGARGCSAIAQAICKKYNIETIIPSDSNTINGIIEREFRYVTISGSFRKHLSYILSVKKNLEEKGAKVLSPRFTEPKNPGEGFVVFSGEEGLSPLELERYHLKSIMVSDALIVCDPDGYVGASALIEIGFAHSLGKRIIFVEKPEEFMLNTLPAEIGL
ncbi:MAG TPA: hypothetical protein PL093_00130 [Candidatus Pacearchaeota archaeon]|nr:hypothetical protein [Candidatus Pacearchaeota archaeon]HQH19971.1 hypothetical protein [Candidatus Pacearchaeota archaeon]HQK58435.1 hypothetical protein [Candidatus Pacearchaeota archaeon]